MSKVRNILFETVTFQQVRVGPRCFDISFSVNPRVEQLKFLQRALKNRKGGQQSLISDRIFVFDFFL